MNLSTRIVRIMSLKKKKIHKQIQNIKKQEMIDVFCEN